VNCILAVDSEREIKLRGQQYAAPLVQGLWKATDKECQGFASLKHTIPKI